MNVETAAAETAADFSIAGELFNEYARELGVAAATAAVWDGCCTRAAGSTRNA